MHKHTQNVKLRLVNILSYGAGIFSKLVA